MTERRLIEAADWVDRLADDAAPESAHDRLAAWQRDPGNLAAYREVATTRRMVADLADVGPLQQLRRETLARLARRSSRARFGAAQAAAAAVALAIVGVPLALTLRGGVPVTTASEYHTEVGQKLEVTLDDGSIVTLDTDSRVRVAYDASTRRLMLLRGQARFDVAKGQPRPFIVTARQQAVTAHGTAFDVRLDPARTRVGLIEGKVTVATTGAGAVAMRPGDLFSDGAAGISVRRDPEALEALTSWKDGLVTAQDQPLAAVVAEMNRYALRPIRVEGAAARLRVSGSFRAGATDSFAAALVIGFPVAVDHAADGAIVLRPRVPKKSPRAGSDFS